MKLSPRKQEILKEVIDAYITTGEPVGSKTLMDKLKTPCSSATIRNEMNDLEKMGLLSHPHTSAGRVPTGRGYRIYVDSLMESAPPSFEETLLLNSLLSQPARPTDQVLGDMAALLARMTGYTIAAFSKERTGTIERFEGVWVNPQSFLLVMITSAGKAITRQLQLEFPLDPDQLAFLVGVLNDHLTKKELGGVTLERIRAMEKELGEFRSLIGPLIQLIYEVMAALGREIVLTRGLSNLLSFPEFREENRAEAILRELENQDLLIHRFCQEFPSGLRVHIASDEPGLDGASFVTCPFRLGDAQGAVCIIGPKRMDYAKAMAKLEYLAKQIHAVHGFRPNLPLIETKG